MEKKLKKKDFSKNQLWKKVVEKQRKSSVFRKKAGLFEPKISAGNYVQKTEKGSDGNYMFFCIHKEKAIGKTYNFSESRLTK